MAQTNWRKQLTETKQRQLPPVIFAADAMNPHTVRLAENPSLYRIRRGVYGNVSTEKNRHDQKLQEILARISAAQRLLDDSSVFSHLSAAALWGLPIINGSSLPYISGVRRHTGKLKDVAWHGVEVSTENRTLIGGVAVTSLARTVVDCARLLSPENGLIIADAALRCGLDRDQALDINANISFPRFRAQAAEVIKFADVGAESPGESRLRIHLATVGWRNLETQVEVSSRENQYFLDLGDPASRVGFEFDGLSKYSDQALKAEKVREHRLRKLGWSVERFMWDDFNRPEVLRGELIRLARDYGVRLDPLPIAHHVLRHRHSRRR